MQSLTGHPANPLRNGLPTPINEPADLGSDYEPADLDLFMRALVLLAQERQGWQIDGRTLALDGWTWVVATWPDEHGELYTVAHDF